MTPAGSGTELQGTLTEAAAPNTAFRIEFFASKPDPLQGVAEGQFFLGFVKVATNASGNAAFDVTLPVKLSPGLVLTATATDPAGNTSEFSAAAPAPTANQFFVDKVYHDLFGRVADPGGLAAWTALLNNGVSPAQVVFLIETNPGHEYYARLVSSFYQFYLHRPEGPPDGAAAANMVNFLAAGGAIEQLRIIFTGSPEYFQTRGGSSNAGYVNALYLDAFGTANRVATDPGAAAFANALSNGSVNRVQVSSVVFTSDEFRFDLVQSYYVQFLHRSGAASEINGWAALLKQGVADQLVIAGILGSPEAFGLATAAPSLAPLSLRSPNSIAPDLDGPLFANIAENGRANITNLYAFRSPGDAPNVRNANIPPIGPPLLFGNTDLAVTVSPFAGSLTPTSFDPRLTLDANVVNAAGHVIPDMTFQVTFAPPVPAGPNSFDQVATLRLIQGNTTTTIAQYTYNSGQTIPPAAFANNVTFPGDAIATGKFLVGAFDDPFFFDAQGYAQFARDLSNPANAFPRSAPLNPAQPGPTEAKNFFHNANTLGFVLEVPTVKLTTANPPDIGVWSDSKFNGTQVDRVGLPLVNALLIPPLPRTDLSRGDRRTAFAQGSPSTDAANFSADMQAVLTSPNFIYQRTQADAAALSNLFLPDILSVDLSKLYADPTNGFPNGRRLRDDVADIELNLVTNGKVPTDNVADDNGATITDGNDLTLPMFPYLGRPNNPPDRPHP